MTLKKPSELFGIKEVSNVVKNVSNIKNNQEENIEEEISSSISEIDGAFKNIQEKIQKSTQRQLQEYKNEFLEIYNYVDNIANEELPKYKKIVHTSDLRVESRINSLKKELYEKLEDHIVQTQKTIQNLYQSEVNQIKSLANNVEVVERYIANHSSDIIKLREEVFEELNKTPINLKDVESKIEKVSNSYNIMSEGLLNNPPSEDNLDPLTPLNQNFVTLEQLNKHYRLFLGRIQQQLSTLGGGGETKLKYLDDIVGIATNASSYDGKYLKYDHTSGKFVFSDVTAGLTTETQTLNNVLRLGNDSSLGIDVGISTFNNSVVVGGSTTALSVSGDVRITGILTVGSSSVTINGVDDILTIGSGVTISGSGSALYSGIITASSFYGDGSNLSGVTTSLVGYATEAYVDNLVSISTFSGDYNDLSNQPNIPSIVGLASEGYVNSLVSISTFSGDYDDLSNQPSIPSDTGDLTNSVGFVTSSVVVGYATEGYVDNLVAISTFSGDYNDLSNTPEIPSIVGLASEGYVDAAIDAVSVSDVSYWNETTAGIHTLSNVGVGTTNPTSALTVKGNTSLETLNVSGISTFNDDVNVGTGITLYSSTGIISATTFYGDLVGSIENATNLTGGTANASSLNVSGIATISQGRIQADASANLRFGNLPVGGSVRNIAIGDQVLSSLSGGNGRNIGIGELSYYNLESGQYNIGVGVQAGQNITTGSYNVILGGYDGQTGLDIRTSSNNVVIADGEGNIRQYIDSNGNVGIKTTIVTEALTVAGVVSATSFYGTLNAGQLTGTLPAIDGSNLFGVVATGAGVEIREDGTPVGTAGTINFGTNIDVTFGSGIATVSGASSVNFASFAGGLDGQPDIIVGDIETNGGITGFTSITGAANQFFTRQTNGETGVVVGINTIPQNNLEGYGTLILDGTYYSGSDLKGGGNIEMKNMGRPYLQTLCVDNDSLTSAIGYSQVTQTFLYRPYVYRTSGTGQALIGITTLGKIGIATLTPTTTLDVFGDANVSGALTATSLSGSLAASNLTGALPALDGSALLNLPAQPGDGINVQDSDSVVGSARTVNFGTGLDVTLSSGIATITASGGSLQSRTTVTGVTTAIANNGIGNTDITGFKSYTLMKVGLSTAGWLRIYTDSASRDADVSRSVGEDPLPGSGVIAEVVTTGVSTTQIISPFVNGGNLDEPATTTIYASIKNLSGSTQAISANLTILQLEA